MMTSKHPVYKWMFPLDDSKLLHQKIGGSPFPSIQKTWLFRVFLGGRHHSGKNLQANFLGGIWNLHPIELVFKKVNGFCEAIRKNCLPGSALLRNISMKQNRV